MAEPQDESGKSKAGVKPHQKSEKKKKNNNNNNCRLKIKGACRRVKIKGEYKR